jgi:hypothetical protein
MMDSAGDQDDQRSLWRSYSGFSTVLPKIAGVITAVGLALAFVFLFVVVIRIRQESVWAAHKRLHPTRTAALRIARLYFSASRFARGNRRAVSPRWR